jgi:hypothetical protein
LQIKSISNKETDQFPDWNRVKIPSTQKPTVSIVRNLKIYLAFEPEIYKKKSIKNTILFSNQDGIEITEGQQQQGTVDPNLDNVTTQKVNVNINVCILLE